MGENKIQSQKREGGKITSQQGNPVRFCMHHTGEQRQVSECEERDGRCGGAVDPFLISSVYGFSLAHFVMPGEATGTGR